MAGRSPRERCLRDIGGFTVVLAAVTVPFYLVGPLIGSLSAVTRGNLPGAALAFVYLASAATEEIGWTAFLLPRVLMVLIAVGSGGSMWFAALTNASYNFAWSLSPEAGAAYNPWTTALLTAAAAVGFYALSRKTRSGPP